MVLPVVELHLLHQLSPLLRFLQVIPHLNNKIALSFFKPLVVEFGVDVCPRLPPLLQSPTLIRWNKKHKKTVTMKKKASTSCSRPWYVLLSPVPHRPPIPPLAPHRPPISGIVIYSFISPKAMSIFAHVTSISPRPSRH